jgi:hypothetical protein
MEDFTECHQQACSKEEDKGGATRRNFPMNLRWNSISDLITEPQNPITDPRTFSADRSNYKLLDIIFSPRVLIAIMSVGHRVCEDHYIALLETSDNM